MNGISLRVETRIVLLDKKHLVDKTIKFSGQHLKPREIKAKLQNTPPLICTWLNSSFFLFSSFWSVERICKLVAGYSEVAPKSSLHIMSAIQLDTFTNVLTNITTLRSLLDSLWDTSLLKEVQFHILKNCQGKFACFVYQMLFIKERNPRLDTQTDSIRAKLLFKRKFNHVLSYLVFKHFLSFILWLDSDVSQTSKRLLRNIQSQISYY